MASSLNTTTKTLQYHLIRWLILIAIMPLLLTAIGMLLYMEAHLLEETKQDLYTFARDKKTQVKEEIAQIQSITESIKYVDTIKKNLVSSSPERTAQLDRFAKNLLAQHDHHDLLLINTQGKIVYSLLHESDFQADIPPPTWQDSLLQLTFEQASILQQTIISPYRWYEPSQRYSAFVASPVLDDDGIWIGVVVIQLNDHWLQQIASSRVGSTDTGEVVIALADTKNDEADQTIHLHIRTNKTDKVLLTPQQKPVLARPARLSIIGNEGWGKELDYRGVAVLAGWVHIPELQLGLVVKEDLQEVMQPILWLRSMLALALLAVVTLILLMTMWFSRRFVQPVRHISYLVKALSMGQWHYRIDHNKETDSSEEVRLLTTGINQMADTIEQQIEHLTQQSLELEKQAVALEHHAQDLEQLVAERTAELEILSVVDPLTTLYNRRHYLNEAPNVWRQVARNQQVMAFFMLDIDYFKQYNDTLGHQQGDVALQAVARVLKSFCRRSGDLAFRMGGEEMALVMPLKSDLEVQSIADDIRLNIMGLGLSHPASPIQQLSVSIGVAIFDGRECNTAIEPNFDLLYALADQALYEAKHTGRNKALVSEHRVTCDEVAINSTSEKTSI